MTEERKQGEQTPSGTFPAGLVAVLVAGAVLIGTGLGISFYSLSPGMSSETARLAGEGATLGAEASRAEPGRRFRVQFETASMFPDFSPDQRRYVTRCGPSGIVVRVNAFRGAMAKVQGSAAATGRYEVEARPVPGQDFRITVSGAGRKLNGRYSVRCLPVGFPKWGYSRFRKPPEGIFTVAFRPRPPDRNRSWIIAFDQAGVPRWWLSPNVNALWGEILPDGTVAWGRGFGDGFGQDSRTGIELTDLSGRPGRLIRTVGTPNDSHEFVPLPNGNSLVMSYRPRLGVDLTEYGLGKQEGVLDGEIQEVDPSGKVVWRWNSGDHIGLNETPKRWWEIISTNPHTDPAGRDRYDVFHLNSIQRIGDGLLLISTRHTDAVFAISRKTGEVVWKLGGTPKPNSLRILGPDPHREDPLSGNHDARLVDGVLSIHDNGTMTGRRPRMVNYRIDPEAGTATFLSQIRAPKELTYSHCCGGARRFGSGWLVSWGNAPIVAGYDRRGKIAFRLGLPVPSYRVLPVPASVDPRALDRATEAAEDAPGPPGRAIGPIVRVPAPRAEDASG